MRNFFNIYESLLTERHHWPEYYRNLGKNILMATLSKDISGYDEIQALKDSSEIIDKMNPFIIHEPKNRKLFRPAVNFVAELLLKNENRKKIFGKGGELDFIVLGIQKSLSDELDQIKVADKLNAMTLDEFKKYIHKIDSKSSSSNVHFSIQKNNYKAIIIQDYKQFHTLFGGDKTGYGKGSEWCTANSLRHYKKYLSTVENRYFVVLQREDWEKINPEECLHGEDIEKHNPYDAYGLSLIGLVVDFDLIKLENPKLNLINAVLRWNCLGDFSHSTIKNFRSDHAFIDFDSLSRTLGIDVVDLIIKEFHSTFAEKLKEIRSKIEQTNYLVDQKIKNLENEYKQTKIKFSLGKINRDYISEIRLPGSFIPEGYCFANCKRLKNVIFEPGCEELYFAVFINCINLKTVQLPETLKRIGDRCFEHCENLSEINIPSSVIKLDGTVFANCKSLKWISLPENLSVIPGSCFAGCSSLIRIQFPKSCTKIEINAFAECKSFYSLEIPSNIEEIGQLAFESCDNLSKIKFEEGLKVLKHRAFYKCSKLKKLVFPSSLKIFGHQAFQYCSKLESIEFKSVPEYIQEECFYDCENLKKIIVPKEAKKYFKFEKVNGIEFEPDHISLSYKGIPIINNKHETIDLFANSNKEEEKEIIKPEIIIK